jgi:hypothetical protein
VRSCFSQAFLRSRSGPWLWELLAQKSKSDYRLTKFASRPNPLNTMSRTKAPSIIMPRLEMSPGDEGSLWDEGPVYDLSQDELDY